MCVGVPISLSILRTACMIAFFTTLTACGLLCASPVTKRSSSFLGYVQESRRGVPKKVSGWLLSHRKRMKKQVSRDSEITTFLVTFWS